MSEKSGEMGTIQSPSYLNIVADKNQFNGNKSITPQYEPYVNNSSLPLTYDKIRNYNFKRKKKKKTNKDTPEHTSSDGEDSSMSVSYKELQLFKPVANKKPIHYENSQSYVDNYKSILRAKGIKYQEIFGHTPRKPEQRLGMKTEKSNAVFNGREFQLVGGYHHRSDQQSPVTSEFKLPNLDSDNTFAVNEDYNNNEKVTFDTVKKSLLQKEGVKYHSKTDDMTSLAETMSYTCTEDGYQSDKQSGSLSHGGFPNSGMNKRRYHRKRGKLGEVMTHRKMQELLEAKEPLKLESYFNIYS